MFRKILPGVEYIPDTCVEEMLGQITYLKTRLENMSLPGGVVGSVTRHLALLGDITCPGYVACDVILAREMMEHSIRPA